MARNDTAIEIHRIDAETLAVPIIGTAPLIVHRFAEKARRQMLDNMQGRKSPKQAKDPAAEYEAAFYRCTDGKPGFPVVAFKQATVGGARFFAAVTMTQLKQCLFFRGEAGADGQVLVRIEGTPHMREDVVRVNRGGADLRYRPEFPEGWKAQLVVTYVASALTRNSVLSLIDAGGLVGVGEWRPERGGTSGTYAVDSKRKVTVK